MCWKLFPTVWKVVPTDPVGAGRHKKMALIEQTLKPGANVSAIARQAGIAPAQLFGWRRKAMQAGVVQGEPHEQRLGFVEVTSPSSAMIEIVIADMVVRVSADTDQNHLVNILRAVRQA